MRKKIWIASVIGAVVLALVVFTICFLSPVKSDLVDKRVDTLVVAPSEMLYGLPKDSFGLEELTVRANQFLSDILSAKGISYQTIDQMVKVCNPLFDFRKMNVGHQFVFFMSRKSPRQVEHLVYEIDKLKYIKVSMGDTIKATLGEKEIVHVEKTASAKIRSSLWKTIQENNLSPGLAIQLSDVFAWSVDFFGIEKGDYFKVMYREDHVDGECIGIGKIHAAVFSHHKKVIYAFNFDQDGVWDFFDEKGQSLRKAFLKAPLKFNRISSRFSNARLHPILKILRPHHGIDYAAPSGTPVHSIGDGRVVVKGWDGKGGGNYIKIAHNSVYATVYMHLSGFAPGVSQGQSVKQGQLIGFVGSTGLSSGPHLDFRVFQNGKPIDPLSVESPPVEPVKPENVSRYLTYISPLKKTLDGLPFSEVRKPFPLRLIGR